MLKRCEEEDFGCGKKLSESTIAWKTGLAHGYIMTITKKTISCNLGVYRFFLLDTRGREVCSESVPMHPSSFIFGFQVRRVDVWATGHEGCFQTLKYTYVEF